MIGTQSLGLEITNTVKWYFLPSLILPLIGDLLHGIYYAASYILKPWPKGAKLAERYLW